MKRSGPIKRGKPMRARRKAKPRRTPLQEAHFARVAAIGCLVCGEPATLHHVTASIHGGRLARSEERVVPLAPRYHLIQHGPRESVEALGHGGFYEAHGIDLLAVAERLWAETVALHG